ncbi:MAG: bifunctional riboflavin kinase/FAD synthetase [Candidatus Microthrix parvicella]|uniref:bifunctional riboflavin kinase/FAD synthetase n=1 Tax=Candidatus Neomicrothrix sp. TaxID=2719034 RepID=UPI0016B3013F|nr:bifunctional riboflavin kinase/FAD synthetase [Candidatus Microthrix sp.]NLH68470.1 bifunctional riboflavin kinase/FAD synthetase [Candidatus Microthrix parvicella]
MLILGDGAPRPADPAARGSSADVPWDGAAVTIGAYDGVHLGHRAVIGRLADAARERGLASVVVTFEPHPARVLRPDSAPRLLCDTATKLELLAETGVDATYVMAFDADRALEEPEHFIKRLLVDELRSRMVMVGADFRFGHRRGGDVTMLEDAGADVGFKVEGLPLVGADGQAARVEEQVSSTAIRRALTEGRLDAANVMLGRPHELRGVVVEGDRRGRTWGFPTANVAVAPEMLRPEPGICAGWLVRADGTELPAAIYLGNRPTVYGEGGDVVLEVHVLDWQGDLYGETVAVRFTHRIRGDAAFDTFEGLTQQIGRDCDQARRLLGVATGSGSTREVGHGF